MIIATAKLSPIPLIVAGGINLERLRKLRGTPLAAVVVGGAVIGADNPALEAQRIAEVLQVWDNA
jgi:3-keto-L-gulonate-6-phosphate decarboxylase